MTLTEQMLASMPGNPLEGLRRADTFWTQYRQGDLPVADVVQTSPDLLNSIDWDVVICGGTLGIVLGTALVQQGWRVAVLERGILRGREQEWNISRRELGVLVELELLTEQELERAIATDYHPGRVSFHKGPELWVEDVLNVGVDPVYLLEVLKQRFLSLGGTLFEHTAFEGAIVHPDGVRLKVGDELTTRLVVDMMGHFSPIVRQARRGQRPDSVCLVVGTCAKGFSDNDTGDIFTSFTPIQNHCQYFWEAFPARDGRTTYLFTYADAEPERPSLEELFEAYWTLLPEYQNVSLEQIQPVRALFGFFPGYRNSPLQLPWNRMLAVGDSSGNQSPLSFGGFGAMMRHLKRLSKGITEALSADALTRSDLGLLQPYQPNLSVTWLFQRSMSVGLTQTLPPNQINDLLAGVFDAMTDLGDPVLKPFLQDVVQFSGLSQTLLRTSIKFPLLGLSVIPHVGIAALLEWAVHYINLGIYTGLGRVSHAIHWELTGLSPTQRYRINRWIDAWTYGSGHDYHS